MKCGFICDVEVVIEYIYVGFFGVFGISSIEMVVFFFGWVCKVYGV